MQSGLESHRYIHSVTEHDTYMTYHYCDNIACKTCVTSIL